MRVTRRLQRRRRDQSSLRLLSKWTSVHIILLILVLSVLNPVHSFGVSDRRALLPLKDLLRRRHHLTTTPTTTTYRHPRRWLQHPRIGGLSTLSSSANLDYEYLPPKPNNPIPSHSHSSSSFLPSSYPHDTPPGLVGEAVRSAILSTRGICIDLTSNVYDINVNVGVVKVGGEGTMDFLSSKFSNSFPLPLSSSDKDNTESSFSPKVGTTRQACLLTPRGRIIDILQIATLSSTEAYIVTSPGHSGSALFERLDPYIFPMDQVELIDLCPTKKEETTLSKKDESKQGSRYKTKVFMLASSTLKNVQNIITKFVLSNLGSNVQQQHFQFPAPDGGQCLLYQINNNNDSSDDDTQLLIMEQTFLPSCACVGYTILITEPKNSNVASTIWETLISEHNEEGPVEIGPKEFDTLRIECGYPGYGHEMTGDDDDGSFGSSGSDSGGDSSLSNNLSEVESNDKDDDTTTTTNKDKGGYKASPLELHLNSAIDFEKGCYQGQEGIASIHKNKRGPPRTLYTVIFDDDSNVFSHQTQGEYKQGLVENLTFLPRPGQELYVLGSNEQIRAGVLTSVAENGSTGESNTVGMALIRRPTSILTKMKEMDLEVGYVDPFQSDPLWNDDANNEGNSLGSGRMEPPPLDPLDGLEVIVGGTYTVGTLRVVPSRRYKLGQNMFDEDTHRRSQDDGSSDFEQQENSAVMGFIDVESLPGQKKHARTPPVMGVDDSTATTKNPWDDVDIPSKSTPPPSSEGASTAIVDAKIDDEENDMELNKAMEEAAKAAMEAEAAAAEAQRKAEKMEMLKKRAEEAMARRKKKQQQKE